MPAVGPPKIGTIADLALNPILLLDEADGGGLEDPHGLRDGRRVLVANVLVHAKGAGAESTKGAKIDGDSRCTG